MPQTLTTLAQIARAANVTTVTANRRIEKAGIEADFVIRAGSGWAAPAFLQERAPEITALLMRDSANPIELTEQL